MNLELHFLPNFYNTIAIQLCANICGHLSMVDFEGKARNLLEVNSIAQYDLRSDHGMPFCSDYLNIPMSLRRFKKHQGIRSTILPL
jgi:hypothetical protein